MSYLADIDSLFPRFGISYETSIPPKYDAKNNISGILSILKNEKNKLSSPGIRDNLGFISRQVASRDVEKCASAKTIAQCFPHVPAFATS